MIVLWKETGELKRVREPGAPRERSTDNPDPPEPPSGKPDDDMYEDVYDDPGQPIYLPEVQTVPVTSQQVPWQAEDEDNVMDDGMEANEADNVPSDKTTTRSRSRSRDRTPEMPRERQPRSRSRERLPEQPRERQPSPPREKENADNLVKDKKIMRVKQKGKTRSRVRMSNHKVILPGMNLDNHHQVRRFRQQEESICP